MKWAGLVFVLLVSLGPRAPGFVIMAQGPQGWMSAPQGSYEVYTIVNATLSGTLSVPADFVADITNGSLSVSYGPWFYVHGSQYTGIYVDGGGGPVKINGTGSYTIGNATVDVALNGDVLSVSVSSTTGAYVWLWIVYDVPDIDRPAPDWKNHNLKLRLNVGASVSYTGDSDLAAARLSCPCPV